ncbi:rod-binding protein [Roseibacterium sp. SDUM158016]|uniref:rod-binding protein n=1 Tax=Roseicyclus sediminis TaxID=2980997 RepID=UPI0021CF7E93|nr:rod-binding protein [Roseibacterium sp. SDUM158016]MCU4654330.1 rod-binding protein [Roseibacterium sp. SDUM158016]
MTEASPVAVHVAAISARPLAGAAEQTAQDFEALFLSQTVDQLLRTVPEGMMGGGHVEEMWRSFLANAIAEEMAAGGRAGIAQSVEAAIAGYSRTEGGSER